MVLLKTVFTDYTNYLSGQIKSEIKTTFDYKIIYNILPTKVSLFRAKICDDDICPQCFADRHSFFILGLTPNMVDKQN